MDDKNKLHYSHLIVCYIFFLYILLSASLVPSTMARRLHGGSWHGGTMITPCRRGTTGAKHDHAGRDLASGNDQFVVFEARKSAGKRSRLTTSKVQAQGAAATVGDMKDSGPSPGDGH
ncbi:hypothetical protein Dimus_002570 [Dionaea muscipula]